MGQYLFAPRIIYRSLFLSSLRSIDSFMYWRWHEHRFIISRLRRRM
jgi:hypothetical protein